MGSRVELVGKTGEEARIKVKKVISQIANMEEVVGKQRDNLAVVTGKPMEEVMGKFMENTMGSLLEEVMGRLLEEDMGKLME